MKTVILIAMLIIACVSYAQFENINPDPNGDPWWVFNGEDSLCIDQDFCINHAPLLLTSESETKELPYQVDNSLKKYFRPVFYQGAAVCIVASKIGYIFTYEINRERDVSAEDSVNLYSHYYAANFYDWWSDSEDSVTFIENKEKFGSVELIRKNGIPNIIDFGGVMVDPDYHWVNGYDKYYRAMHNRTISEWLG